MHVVGVLFTGTDKAVLSSEGQPLRMADGRTRKGRGLSEGTFRKHFHGLKTLHVHFQRKQVYEVRIHCPCVLVIECPACINMQFNSETNKWEGNPCKDPTVQVTCACIVRLYVSLCTFPVLS